MKKVKEKKYVATLAGQEHVVNIGPGDQITLDGILCPAHLESIDGDTLFSLLLCNASHEVFVERRRNKYYVVVEGNRYEVVIEDEALRHVSRPSVAALQAEGQTTVTSPMPGIVVAVLAQEGERVQAGEGVAILEAMKMENEIRAPRGGVVQSVQVAPGQTVNQNEVLVTIGASESPLPETGNSDQEKPPASPGDRRFPRPA